MKLLIVALCAACAFADVSHVVGKNDNDAQILAQELDVNPDGSYSWRYESSDGIKSEAQGQLINGNTENAAIAAQGRSSWISPEGEQVVLEYVADENGYQPRGSHIPTPHPIPEDILRSLEYIKAHPQPEEKN